MITQRLLKQLFYYDGNQFIWKVNAGNNRIKKNTIAGWINKLGYRAISINNKTYSHPRLVWLYHYGSWPKGEIDHINRERSDDRIENLRDVFRSENNINRSVTGKIPHKYISLHSSGNYYRFRIKIEGKDKTIKYGKSLDEVVCFRNKWIKENMPERLRFIN